MSHFSGTQNIALKKVFKKTSFLPIKNQI